MTFAFHSCNVVSEGPYPAQRHHTETAVPVNLNPALSTETSAHFDLGVDQLANAGEIASMGDPWVGTVGSAALGLSASPAELPVNDLSPWASGLHLPGV